MFCKGCGNGIDGKYIQHNGGAYHSACYTRLYVPNCAYCQKPLIGQYLIDHWGTTFCPRHENEFPSCSFCGRLVPSREHERANSINQWRCTHCYADAVETVERAQPIFSQLVHWFHNQGLSCNNLRIQIDLINQQELSSLQPNGASQRYLGLTLQRVLLASGIRTAVDKVVILRGLPSIVFQGVAVHELGHVWLAVRVATMLPPWAEEGFCEFIAYRYYTQLATEEGRFQAERIAQNPDPIYGQGFRRVYATAQAVGFQQLLQTLQTTRQMP